MRRVMQTQSSSSPSSTSSPPRHRAIRNLGFGIGFVGAALWTVRYIVQGTQTVWTDNARTFYTKDSNLGFRPTDDAWAWLGLDGLGVIAAVIIGVAALRFLVSGKGETAGFRRVVGTLVTIGSVILFAAPVLPVIAFVSGMPPEGAIAVLPGAEAGPAVVAGAGPVSVAAPGGRYVPAGDESLHLVAAQITAGGETFDARFSGLGGHLDLVPTDLAASKARISVAAGTVKTGVPLRDKHALEYLKGLEFKEIAVDITTISAVVSAPTPGEFSWSGEVDVAFMGRVLKRPASGRVRVLDPTARSELKISDATAILVEVTFVILIADTELDRPSFDSGEITITARSVLVPKS